VTTSSEADALMRALSEANMATETGLIILDVLVVYTDKFKVTITIYIILVKMNLLNVIIYILTVI
jgi:hypothetical protein